MNILGVTDCVAWNAGACLLKDGELVAFAEEERFTRLKHAAYIFPDRAIEFCLRKGNLNINDIDILAIAHSDLDTIRNFWESDECLTPALIEFPDWKELEWFPEKTTFYQEKRKFLDTGLAISKLEKTPLQRYHHNDCHAASATWSCPFTECNYMTADGEGGEDAGVFGYFKDDTLHRLGFYHQLGPFGGFYTDITIALGFKKHSAEGKTMGLASYGKIDKKLLPEFFQLYPHGILQPKGMEYFQFLNSFDEDLKIKLNVGTTGKITEEACNLAATAQHYLEKLMINNFKVLYEHTANKNFAVAGGTFLNCSMNGRLSQCDFVDHLFVQPAAHDSGSALGAAILCHMENL
jgi:carbamoyltransferase